MTVKISSFLVPNDVLLDFRARDKTTLLRELATRASLSTGLAVDVIVAELMKREQLGSTGMGGGVAIPHARYAGLKKPFGLVARLKPAIDFDAIDNLPVDLVFVLLVPSAVEGDHLNLLAAVSRRMRSREVTQKLRSLQDPEIFYRLLTAEPEKH
ncbi:PTS sugar transporter subunit IIA [Hyphomicrobium sp.]|uniref:PTS sugar transporter subunit IIA n=1 Tax=Hyphomicrobium sp. TaxID=82 RepID=UPI002D76B01B|nr:PTS sugar transporter subunit IIA [Hyphomicrobium sp.]HET6390675.1 PTS sugar transporter subunit IIA [Hyphomicrobium sp.]